ncbi:hypothetical protein ACFL1V_04445 [Pseudomonadota bacterium]
MEISTERNSEAGSSAKTFLGHFGIFFIMLCYPLLGMLWRHQYPIVSVEVFLFFISISLLALLLSALTAACRPWLSNVIFAICITIVLVLQFNLFFEGSLILIAVMVILAITAKQTFLQLTFAVFVALIIGAFIDSTLDQQRNDSQVVQSEQQASLPPVVHIILDEFIGPDGLPPQDVPQAFRADILAFFEENDFELYNRAYTHYHTTQDSLTHAFNFTNDEETWALKAEIFHTKLSISENRYFELLRQRGYTINIYQSELVEFCQAVPEAVGRCMTHTAPNFETVRENVSSPWLRFRILAINLFEQSNLIRTFLEKRKWLLDWGVSFYQPKIIDEIGNDLEQARGGAYFAHLLLPHTPFVYNEDCELDYSSESWKRYVAQGLVKNNVDTRALRYLQYLPHAQCALKEVGRLFGRMRELDLYDDAIIIVHGDHGSAISLHSAHRLNQDKLTPEDYRDLFSTLFAIKLPGGQYREHDETISLNVLMSRTAMEITGKDQPESAFGVITEESPFIYLSGQFPLTRQEIDIFAQP